MASLICKASVPMISFRGNLVRRHTSITGWSLTSYLKTLHTGGMSWEAIYWHVWASCIVMRPTSNIDGRGRDSSVDFMISALDVDRYSFEERGLLIYSR